MMGAKNKGRTIIIWNNKMIWQLFWIIKKQMKFANI